MNKKPNLAIVGATGGVGSSFLKVLEEVDFPFDNLYIMASAKSAGTTINFKGKDYVVEELTEHSFDKDIDIALFSAGGAVSEKFAPYCGTLIVFLGLGSMLGLLDFRPITSDLNCTFPLALVTFVLIHYNAVKAQTGIGYIKELSSPYPFMLPLNIISDSMFPVTLACRIFGNILAGVILMGLVYSGLHTASAAVVNIFADVPRESVIPFFQIGWPLILNFWFDMFEPILQAYIFVMLTMVFIDNGRHPVES